MKHIVPFAVFLLAAAITLQCTTPASAQEAKTIELSASKLAGVAKRAKRSVETVTKQMELSDEQKELLQTALTEKFTETASKMDIDTPNAERREIWKAANTALSKKLSAKFTKKEIREANKLIREANAAGKLFNGKDLTGWKQVNGTATYEVIDGEIVGTTMTGSPNSFLATTKNYGNFDLQFEVFLVNNELNSGVQFRSNQHTEETLEEFKKKQPIGRVFGYQCEIEAAAEGDMDTMKYGDAGYIYDEARRGWLVDDETRHAAKTRNAFRNHKWNRIRIVANGDHIQTWINGKKICDLKDDMTASGFIALQVHGIGKKEDKWQVKWRNISIKELK